MNFSNCSNWSKLSNFTNWWNCSKFAKVGKMLVYQRRFTSVTEYASLRVKNFHVLEMLTQPKRNWLIPVLLVIVTHSGHLFYQKITKIATYGTWPPLTYWSLYGSCMCFSSCLVLKAMPKESQLCIIPEPKLNDKTINIWDLGCFFLTVPKPSIELPRSAVLLTCDF